MRLELTRDSEHETEEQGKQHEVQTEIVRVDHSGETEEHEDDRLRDVGQHLHEILHGGRGLLGHVQLRVVPHHNTTKR